MSKEENVIQKILNELGSMMEIKVSEPQCFVGLEIKRDRKRKTTFISQQNYISRILKGLNMDNCRAVTVPADPNTNLTSNNDNQEYEDIEMSKIPYRQAVGNLMLQQ